MGSSSEPNTEGIDGTVGGLVWVRRRNGSWWPGRIMGVDELSESCLVSPRSGTPVKLLGREDASVDWYNLERSKRVKAFRCGEYDECIEKAKAYAANSSKKAVKYARREDAILHALELESARQPKDHTNFCSKKDKSGGEHKEPTISHSSKETEDMDEESSNFKDNSNLAQEVSLSGMSFEESNRVSASKVQSVQGRRRTPNDSEDDGTEGVKRMKGLEDLGMGVASSLQRKRSQVAPVHEFLKRKYRRRPLTKVFESTAMVSVPIMCEKLPSPNGSPPPGVSDSKVSGLESNGSKRSFSVVLNNSDSTGVSYENGISLNASGHVTDASPIHCKQNENEISSISGLPVNDSSGNLFDVPFVADEKPPAGLAPNFVSCSSQNPQVGAGGQSSQCNQVETLSLGNDELNKSDSTSSGAADIASISKRMDKGSSKWQLKGKRNSRYTSKNKTQVSRKYVDVDDESNAYFSGLEPGDVLSVGSGLKADHDPRAFLESQEDDYWGWRGRKVLPDCSPTVQRSLPFRHFAMNPRYQTADFPVRNYDDSFLFDVNLEVKASYRPQHVPYISLMSKLNGQPIIGHPLTVEVVDDGFCDLLVSGPRPECYLTSSSCELDDDLEDNMSAFRGVDTDYEAKPNRGGGRTPSKRLKLHRVSQRGLPSKSRKIRKNGFLTKKIRKLSSLTSSHRRNEDEKKPVVEKIEGPAVACVHLKVVFSRINASLNSSMRPAHCVTTSDNP
ncbi:PWWP domain protein [Actinidia chinensis var. chinensis]|uniref:PWWP domain protein n=1 Tax=Actinidia chinensis var. chinensis TaxID=1590841 RepID=A0A2R6R075_ACTCC|nr:PWWP domain protein [Actinidia chinensis var. chinensis]